MFRSSQCSGRRHRPWLMAGSKAGAAQHAGQRDQRQADQCGRVVVVDALEQADAKAFALEAAGAVQRLLALDVAGDLVRVQRRGSARGSWSTWLCRWPLRVSSRHRPVWKRTCRPSWQQVVRMRASTSPGLSSTRPSSSATWSEPITSASGYIRCRGFGLGDGQAQARSRPATRRAARLRRCPGRAARNRQRDGAAARRDSARWSRAQDAAADGVMVGSRRMCSRMALSRSCWAWLSALQQRLQPVAGIAHRALRHRPARAGWRAANDRGSTGAAAAARADRHRSAWRASCSLACGQVGVQRHHRMGLLQPGAAGLQIGFQPVGQIEQGCRLLCAAAGRLRAGATAHGHAGQSARTAGRPHRASNRGFTRIAGGERSDASLPQGAGCRQNAPRWPRSRPTEPSCWLT